MAVLLFLRLSARPGRLAFDKLSTRLGLLTFPKLSTRLGLFAFERRLLFGGATRTSFGVWLGRSGAERSLISVGGSDILLLPWVFTHEATVRAREMLVRDVRPFGGSIRGVLGAWEFVQLHRSEMIPGGNGLSGISGRSHSNTFGADLERAECVIMGRAGALVLSKEAARTEDSAYCFRGVKSLTIPLSTFVGVLGGFEDFQSCVIEEFLNRWVLDGGTIASEFVSVIFCKFNKDGCLEDRNEILSCL